jgi:hypothetical protein
LAPVGTAKQKTVEAGYQAGPLQATALARNWRHFLASRNMNSSELALFVVVLHHIVDRYDGRRQSCVLFHPLITVPLSITAVFAPQSGYSIHRLVMKEPHSNASTLFNIAPLLTLLTSAN